MLGTVTKPSRPAAYRGLREDPPHDNAHHPQMALAALVVLVAASMLVATVAVRSERASAVDDDKRLTVVVTPTGGHGHQLAGRHQLPVGLPRRVR